MAMYKFDPETRQLIEHFCKLIQKHYPYQLDPDSHADEILERMQATSYLTQEEVRRIKNGD